MAKASVQITCLNCGKTFIHSKIRYNRREADDYEEWAKEHISFCPECLRKQREEEKMQKIEKAIEGIELPALTGSEKQIAWAEKIRNEKILEIDSENIDLHILFDAESNKWAEFCAGLPNSYKNKYCNYWTVLHTDSAKWFIENRD